MISKRLLKLFQFTFTIATRLNIVPFTFDGKNKILKTNEKWYSRAMVHLITVAFGIRSAYNLITLMYDGISMANLWETCLVGFQGGIFFSCTRLEINYWRKRREICGLFNQIQKMNTGTEIQLSYLFRKFVSNLAGEKCLSLGLETRKKSKKSEKMMMTWIPGHLNMCTQLSLDFLKHPNGKQHIFSRFPTAFADSGAVLGIYFIYEAITLFSFVWMSLFEFQLQALLLKSLIGLTAKIR